MAHDPDRPLDRDPLGEPPGRPSTPLLVLPALVAVASVVAAIVMGEMSFLLLTAGALGSMEVVRLTPAVHRAYEVLDGGDERALEVLARLHDRRAAAIGLVLAMGAALILVTLLPAAEAVVVPVALLGALAAVYRYR